MKKLKHFWLNLQFIFMPNYWSMLYPYSEEWDMVLSHLMETQKPEIPPQNSLDQLYYTVFFGEIEVWIQNYPYAYGGPYINQQKKKMRASRLTMLKLNRIVQKAIAEKDIQEVYDSYKWIGAR